MIYLKKSKKNRHNILKKREREREAGIFDQSTHVKMANMPLTGNTKLDMYTIPLVSFDRNSNNTNGSLNL